MGSETILPFKVGELAEAKSFIEGYRGAWFHCKIRRIAKRRGKLQHLLEYYDFPDEKLGWTNLYQVPPHHKGNGKEKHAELILRLAYPPVYNEKQMPPVSEISEVTVIVNNSWKVGDLVDWWNNECYWSGKITRLLGDDEAKIELNPRPFGEGSEYTASLKDVRPSLDWSLEHGWTIPTPEDDTGSPCARLIKPMSQVIQETRTAVQVEADPVQGSAGSSAPLSYPSPVSSNSAVSDAHKQSLEETVSKQPEDGKDKSPTQSRADTDLREHSAESTPKTGFKSNQALKKYRDREEEYEDGCLNCSCRRSDTLEAAVMELEEYVNKVKWLRKILQYGFSSCDAEGPQWEYVDLSSVAEIRK